ncbi:MAG TPA: hypothetical protein VLA19_21585 [Herpetosiphonaceae bacterium]|nr:hypothetical protein [Herpetosiphonaceae bacterium]
MKSGIVYIEKEQSVMIEERDPYWQDDLAIGEVQLWEEARTLRLKLHQSEERFARSRELIPLTQRGGRCLYVHARPYVLVPSITLTLDLAPGPPPGGGIGTVRSSSWDGLRHEEIGQAQAWYYPDDRVLLASS